MFGKVWVEEEQSSFSTYLPWLPILGVVVTPDFFAGQAKQAD